MQKHVIMSESPLEIPCNMHTYLSYYAIFTQYGGISAAGKNEEPFSHVIRSSSATEITGKTESTWKWGD